MTGEAVTGEGMDDAGTTGESVPGESGTGTDGAGAAPTPPFPQNPAQNSAPRPAQERAHSSAQRPAQNSAQPRPHTRVSVRTARPADAGRLAELLAGGALTAKEDPGDVGAYAEALADIEATPGNSVLVAEVDGRVVGLCQLIIFRHLQERGGWCAEVESVHVDASLRSGGIGTALMAAAVQQARAKGCYRVQLTSNVVRVDAQRWYRRLGFTPSHVGFKYVFGDHGGADSFTR